MLSILLEDFKPRAVINFAAESHVDRSIDSPEVFIQTNVVGTFRLLEAARAYWSTLGLLQQKEFRFLHVSTDEVYGSLSNCQPAFTENSRYEPNSPYSASKASSDHLVRAYNRTYGLPVLTTNCSNNYGPYQFQEKLIPLVINNALSGLPITIYGDGKQVRDWLYVKDHCDALCRVLTDGIPGEVYNIGGGQEIQNLDVVNIVCSILDDLKPRSDFKSYMEQIVFIEDRQGHDRRYAINSNKIASELGWKPTKSFDIGIRETIKWYLDNPTLYKNGFNNYSKFDGSISVV